MSRKKKKSNKKKPRPKAVFQQIIGPGKYYG